MANEKRLDLICRKALKRQFIDYVRTPPHFHYGDWQNMCINGTEIDEVIENSPTVDAVPLDQYNELKERYKRLLETADILDSALRAYQRKYGDLDDEDAKLDGGNEDGL